MKFSVPYKIIKTSYNQITSFLITKNCSFSNLKLIIILNNNHLSYKMEMIKNNNLDNMLEIREVAVYQKKLKKILCKMNSQLLL